MECATTKFATFSNSCNRDTYNNEIITHSLHNFCCSVQTQAPLSPFLRVPQLTSAPCVMQSSASVNAIQYEILFDILCQFVICYIVKSENVCFYTRKCVGNVFVWVLIDYSCMHVFNAKLVSNRLLTRLFTCNCLHSSQHTTSRACLHFLHACVHIYEE